MVEPSHSTSLAPLPDNRTSQHGLEAHATGAATGALATAAEALRLAELADDDVERFKSHAFRAHAQALRGEVPAALADFRAALDWQDKAADAWGPEWKAKPLFSLPGIQHTHLLAHLGRREEATRLTEANIEICTNHFSAGEPSAPKCRLIIADLHRESGDLTTAEHLCTSARDWALARDAKEVLCWSALVQARIELAKCYKPEAPASASIEPPDTSETHSLALRACMAAIADGLKIARECGFGLYHIDLLLVRVRWHLLQGDATAALDDLRVALDAGLPADASTGEVELLAATHPECGYAWAIAEGWSLRGEALLHRAAQALVPRLRLGTQAREALPQVTDQLGHAAGHEAEPRTLAFPGRAWERVDFPADIRDVITQAEASLNAALERWQSLRDPARKNANFRHPKTRKQYNYRAAETYRVLSDLNAGVLTRYPLERLKFSSPNHPNEESQTAATLHVFLSHNSKDKPAVRELKQKLVACKLGVWFDEDELRPGIPWQQLIEDGIKTSQSIAVLIGRDGLGPWEDEEMQAALRLAVSDKRPVIPVLMPGAPHQPKLPMFLGNRTWVDLREGLTKTGLDYLIWGITGQRPTP